MNECFNTISGVNLTVRETIILSMIVIGGILLHTKKQAEASDKNVQLECLDTVGVCRLWLGR